LTSAIPEPAFADSAFTDPAFADGTGEFVPAAEQALTNRINAAALSVLLRMHSDFDRPRGDPAQIAMHYYRFVNQNHYR
jgi:hypothetical protein